MSLPRQEEGGRCTCGCDPLWAETPTCVGRWENMTPPEECGRGQREGWKKDREESAPLNNEILKKGLELHF